MLAIPLLCCARLVTIKPLLCCAWLVTIKPLLCCAWLVTITPLLCCAWLVTITPREEGWKLLRKKLTASATLGKSQLFTKYGSAWLFHLNVFNVEHLLLKIVLTRAGPVPVRIWYCGHVSLYDKSQFCALQTADNTDGKVRIEIILLLENNKMLPRKIKTEKKRQNCLQSAAARTADISHVKRWR